MFLGLVICVSFASKTILWILPIFNFMEHLKKLMSDFQAIITEQLKQQSTAVDHHMADIEANFAATDSCFARIATYIR